jgi:glyoxalase family protein
VALEGGIHHITAITADAPGNVDFYARALGLRLVKKTQLATRGPGFDVDEPAESLGESLRLPERYEPLRPQLERTLTPLRNPRAASESPAS